MDWEPLSPSRMAQWYEPWELCMLYKNDSVKYFTAGNVKSCVDQQRGSNSAGKKQNHSASSARGNFHCRLGHLYHNMPCVFGSRTNLLDMSAFFQSVRGFDDPAQRHLLEMLQNLGAARAALVMLGDSTLNAFVSALQCDLKREGLSVSTVQKDILGIKGTQLYSIATPTASSVHETPGAVSMLFKQVPELQPHHLRYMSVYAEHFLDTRHLRGLVLVLQAGTWYHSRARMLPAVKALLDAALQLVSRYARLGKHVTLVWAEQVAQHWPTRNGYFASAKGTPLKQLCRPLANASSAADWRNELVWELLQEQPWRGQLEALAPYVRLDVLGFRALTRDLSSFHMRQQIKDCTHFCYSPLLYQPIYLQLAQLSRTLALDVAAATQSAII